MFVDEVLDPKVAEILSCSLRHREYSAPHIGAPHIGAPHISDPYFTTEEWIAEKDDLIAHLIAEDNPSAKGTTTKITEGTTTTTMLGLDNLRKRKGKGTTTTAEGTETTLKKKKTSCKCVAHISDLGPDLYAVVHALTSIQPPLSDGRGKVMADVLLAYLLKISGQNMIVQAAEMGSIATARYILQLPSGQKLLYSGHPDFYIRQNMTREGWHAGYSRRMEETVRGVGEVQSPPGATSLSKDRALAQSGIYTIGMFSRTDKTTNVATIVFYKDITAHIALATIERVKPPTGVHNIGDAQVGHVKFELLESTNPFNLQIAEDMIRFTNVLIATLRMCSVSVKTQA